MTQRLAKRQDHHGLHVILSAIDADSSLADTTRHQYKRAVRKAVEAGVDLTDARALQQHAKTISRSERGFLRAAIKRLIDAELDAMNGTANPNADNVVELEARMAQTSRKLEAIAEAVPANSGDDGERAHVWLSQSEVRALLETCHKSTLKGRRDHLALAVMVGAGVRRKEASDLTFSDVKQQDNRIVLDVQGKGAKNRVVPISGELAQAIADWSEVIGQHEGRILRSFRRGGHLNESISTDALYSITRRHGAMIGKPDLACHDLRRSYSQIGLEAGIPVHQISQLLGHASIETTMRYLDLHIDLEDTVSDYVPV